MNIQTALTIVIVLYSVSNLLSLGIELNLKETIRSLKGFRLILPAISAYFVARYLGSKVSNAEVTV